jgi:DNA-binding transcriptional MocR family regulator
MPIVSNMEVGRDGLDLERLETVFKQTDIKFFYAVSRFHNPTGHSYTNEDRKKIVELAETYDVYMLSMIIWGIWIPI